MANLNNKSLLVFDLSGSFTHIAERLSQDFGTTKYFSLWQTGFSEVKDLLPCLGLPDVERVANFFDVLDETDLFLFTDVGYGDLQEWLRKEGHAVFGSGRAQELELDRWLLKEKLKTAGMDVAESELVTGIEELGKLLKTEKDKYVKFSYFRGSAETYHHVEWFATETWLNDLATRLGPYGKIATFIVEDPIDGEAVEIGYDTFAVKGLMPENMLWGYEVKDSGSIETTDPLPPRLATHASQLEKILQEYDYRGILSTEVRVTEDSDFLTDFTARCPSPPSETECALIENLAEIIWEGANGRLVEPEFKARYGVQLILKSDWIVDHALGLEIGEPDRVFIHGHFKVDGKDYAVVPEEFPEFGCAVGIGGTLESAIKEAFEAADSVKGHQVHYDASAFDDAMECIEKGNKLGLDWHGKPKLKKTA